MLIQGKKYFNDDAPGGLMRLINRINNIKPTTERTHVH